MPIDLAGSRVLAFQDHKRAFAYTLNPVTQQQWLRYFAGIVSTQELDANGDQTSSFDSIAARLELLESALTGASGWDHVDFSTTTNWQGKLPMSHRRALADLLVATEVDSSADPGDLTLGAETVVLRSIWTAGEDGSMQQIGGLKHVFASPTPDHQRRYSRAYNTSVIVGGSRTGQTRYLGAQAVLIEIYDELIESVEGYTVGLATLGDRGTIRANMDAYHKVAAATALFTPVQVG